MLPKVCSVEDHRRRKRLRCLVSTLSSAGYSGLCTVFCENTLFSRSAFFSTEECTYVLWTLQLQCNNSPTKEEKQTKLHHNNSPIEQEQADNGWEIRVWRVGRHLEYMQQSDTGTSWDQVVTLERKSSLFQLQTWIWYSSNYCHTIRSENLVLQLGSIP